jgi:hypothetical protein
MFDEMGVGIHLPVGDLSARAAPKLDMPYPHMHDMKHDPRAHHHHHHHDEEAQWGPRISLPIRWGRRKVGEDVVIKHGGSLSIESRSLNRIIHLRTTFNLWIHFQLHHTSAPSMDVRWTSIHVQIRSGTEGIGWYVSLEAYIRRSILRKHKRRIHHTTSQPLNSHLNQGTIQAIHTNTTKKRDYNNKTEYATKPNILPLQGVPTILQPPHNLSPTQPNPYPLASAYRKKVGKGKGTYSLASLNSPSSIPSPTNQWTKARLLYIMSNFPSRRFQASAMAVVLELHVSSG